MYVYMYTCLQGMDVRDIQLVVVYGAPDCMNQFQQVNCSFLTADVYYTRACAYQSYSCVVELGEGV